MSTSTPFRVNSNRERSAFAIGKRIEVQEMIYWEKTMCSLFLCGK